MIYGSTDRPLLPSPLVGEGGAKRRMRGLYPRAQRMRREPLTRLRFAKPSSPTRGEGKRCQTADALRRRYSVGVTPVVALNARLKGPSDWKPASIAMVMTGTSA